MSSDLRTRFSVLRFIVSKEIKTTMKKLMIATLGFCVLGGTALFAQNTSTSGTDTMSSTMSGKKHKKSKKTKSTDTASTMSSTK